MTLGDYQIQIGDMVPPPPFLHTKVTMNGMFFDADMQTIQGHIDSTFANIDPEVTCKVVSRAIMLVTLYAGDVRPEDEIYDDRAGISEIDCGFWALVQCGREGQPSRLYWAPLCLVVDSVQAVVIGREIYGFPKMLGSIEPTEPDPQHGLGVDVRTDHFKSTPGGKDQLAKNEQLFSVVSDPAINISYEETTLDNLRHEAFVVIDPQYPYAILSADQRDEPSFPYLDPGMPMLFIRQLRAITHNRIAAYSTVSTATMVPVSLRKIERINDSSLELKLHPSRSFDFGASLGLTDGTKAQLPFRATLDFRAGLGADI